MIGTFLLSDVLVFRKSKFKVIGLALMLGLFFPSVFSTASTITNLNLEVQEATQQKNQAIQATIAAKEELAITSNDTEIKENLIQDIQTLGENSDDPQVQKNAIEHIEAVAEESKDTTVQQQAVKSLEDLGTNSKNQSVKKDAISALENLKIDATSKTLINQVNQSINILKK